jgi:hypothetical protein
VLRSFRITFNLAAFMGLHLGCQAGPLVLLPLPDGGVSEDCVGAACAEVWIDLAGRSADRPFALAADTQHLFVLSTELGDLGRGEVIQVDKGSKTVTSLFSGEHLTDISLDEGALSVLSALGVTQIQTSTGAATTLSEEMDYAFHLFAHHGQVYWSNNANSVELGSLMRVSSQGGPTTPLVKGGVRPTDLTVVGEQVYFLNSDPVLDLRRISTLGGAPEVLTSVAPQGAIHLVADVNALYWTQGDRIMRMPTSGGDPEVLASGQDAPLDLALSDLHVYWTNYGHTENSGTPDVTQVPGALMRVSKTGGPAKLLASGQVEAHALLLDSTHVYWSAQWRVMRMATPD